MRRNYWGVQTLLCCIGQTADIGQQASEQVFVRNTAVLWCQQHVPGQLQMWSLLQLAVSQNTLTYTLLHTATVLLLVLILCCAQAETFQNTTIIVVMDIAHSPKDTALVDRVSKEIRVGSRRGGSS